MRNSCTGKRTEQTTKQQHSRAPNKAPHRKVIVLSANFAPYSAEENPCTAAHVTRRHRKHRRHIGTYPSRRRRRKEDEKATAEKTNNASTRQVHIPIDYITCTTTTHTHTNSEKVANPQTHTHTHTPKTPGLHMHILYARLSLQ